MVDNLKEKCIWMYAYFCVIFSAKLVIQDNWEPFQLIRG